MPGKEEELLEKFQPDFMKIYKRFDTSLNCAEEFGFNFSRIEYKISYLFPTSSQEKKVKVMKRCLWANDHKC